MDLLTSLLTANAPLPGSGPSPQRGAGKNIIGEKRKREKMPKKNDNVERDKWGKIIKTCGINGCTHRTGNSTNMKVHKANNHGIGIKWFSCPEVRRSKRSKATCSELDGENFPFILPRIELSASRVAHTLSYLRLRFQFRRAATSRRR